MEKIRADEVRVSIKVGSKGERYYVRNDKSPHVCSLPTDLLEIINKEDGKLSEQIVHQHSYLKFLRDPS